MSGLIRRASLLILLYGCHPVEEVSEVEARSALNSFYENFEPIVQKLANGQSCFDVGVRFTDSASATEKDQYMGYLQDSFEKWFAVFKESSMHLSQERNAAFNVYDISRNAGVEADYIVTFHGSKTSYSRAIPGFTNPDVAIGAAQGNQAHVCSACAQTRTYRTAPSEIVRKATLHEVGHLWGIRSHCSGTCLMNANTFRMAPSFTVADRNLISQATLLAMNSVRFASVGGFPSVEPISGCRGEVAANSNSSAIQPLFQSNDPYNGTPPLSTAMNSTVPALTPPPPPPTDVAPATGDSRYHCNRSKLYYCLFDGNAVDACFKRQDTCLFQAAPSLGFFACNKEGLKSCVNSGSGAACANIHCG